MSALSLFDPWFEETYADAVRAQVVSGWVGPGKTTARFAEGIADYVSVPHCLLTTSGTLALSVAAIALGLQPGDEILVPAYGVVSTINAFASIGLRPRLVDIEQSTGCMSPDELDACIRPQTRAVCFVNFSGYTGQNLTEVAAICAEHDLPLIEDSACAFGHRYQGRAAGTFGTIGIYSFSAQKILTTGQGGAIVTASDTLSQNALRYTDHGDTEWRKTNRIRDIGTNLRFNDILSSFGLAQLQDVEARLARKRAAHNVLREGLGSKLFQVPGENAPLHNIVFTPDPLELIDALREEDIQAIQTYRTLSQHPPYAHLAEAGYPNANYWTDRAVYLPFGLALTPDDAERIVDAVLNSGVYLERADFDAREPAQESVWRSWSAPIGAQKIANG